MARNYLKNLCLMILLFNIQEALAGDAWLMIMSDPSGAAISIDNLYIGVTPQKPGDALRIKVAEGTHEVGIRKQIDGREYATTTTANAVSDKEIFIRFNLYENSNSVLVVTKTMSIYSVGPQIISVSPIRDLEIPGKNF